MIDDKSGQQLHDRATRGLPLSEEERAQLDAWYKKLDEEEAAWLTQPDLAPLIEETRRQTSRGWDEIAALVQQIQETRRENEGLRRENEGLLKQVRQKLDKAA